MEQSKIFLLMIFLELVQCEKLAKCSKKGKTHSAIVSANVYVKDQTF